MCPDRHARAARARTPPDLERQWRSQSPTPRRPRQRRRSWRVCYRLWPMSSKRALITGITGQDGSYLAELLLEKNYEVFGLTRRLSTSNYWRIEHLLDRITIIPGDLLDQLSLIR